DLETAGFDGVIDTFLRRRKGIAIARREFPELELDPCGSVDYDPVNDAGRELLGQLNVAAGEELYSVRPANLGGAEREAYFNAADAGVHPVRLLQLLQARSPHARYAFGVRAVRVGDGTAELEVAGRRIELKYRRAFICTNAFAAELD